MLNKAILDSAKKMMIDFEGITSKIEHAGIKGDAREEIVKNFLIEYIPETFGIAKGLVVDSVGSQSKQEDLMIYDRAATPRFLSLGSAVILPVESVRAVVEVKSTLTVEHLKDALTNIASVRGLPRAHLPPFQMQTQLPFGLVFTYTSRVSLDRIVDELRESDVPRHFGPTAVICLDRGCVISLERSNLNNMALLPGPTTTWGKRETSDSGHNLMIFYLLMMHGLFQCVALTHPCPDLIAYANNSGFVSAQTNVKTGDAAGCLATMNGHQIDLDRIRALQSQVNEVCADPSPERLRAFIQEVSEATSGFIPTPDDPAGWIVKKDA
jgi:hypothetical protein